VLEKAQENSEIAAKILHQRERDQRPLETGSRMRNRKQNDASTVE
jgi:hypothetical protein